jgi:hypothetical protein
MSTLNFFDSHHGWYCKIVEMPLMFHVTMRIEVSLGSTSGRGYVSAVDRLLEKAVQILACDWPKIAAG